MKTVVTISDGLTLKETDIMYMQKHLMNSDIKRNRYDGKKQDDICVPNYLSNYARHPFQGGAMCPR